MSAVVRESLCPRCANTGQQLHPAWEQLLGEWQELYPEAPPEPEEDFINGWFWARECASPIPRYTVCECRTRITEWPDDFAVLSARIEGRQPYPCALEPSPERLRLSYLIGGERRVRRIPLKRLAAFLEMAEQKLGLRLDEEGETS